MQRLGAGLSVIGLLVGTAWGGAAILSWDPNAEPDLAGYVASWGTASRQYTTEIDVGLATSASFSDLPDGVEVFFAVTAYDTSDNVSAYSAEVSKVMSSGTDDTERPRAAMTMPDDGATVPRKGRVTITVEARDNVEVAHVEITVQRQETILERWIDVLPPYTAAWTVPAAKRAAYTLTAVAVDTAGLVSEPDRIQVVAQ